MRKLAFITMAIVLSILALVGSTTGAYASTIYACVSKFGGFVRIVDKTTTCAFYEKSVTWDNAGTPPLTIGASNGVVKITGVGINGGPSNQAHVGPGADFTVAFNYTITDDGCPGCIDQIEVGLADEPPTTCAYDGIPGTTPGVSASATVTLTAPTTPGTYYIAFDRSQHYSCDDALGMGRWWSFSVPAPQTNYIAGIAVY